MTDTPTDENLSLGAAGGAWSPTVWSGVLLVWMVITSAFFYIRFTFVFYDSHREAILALIHRVFGN